MSARVVTTEAPVDLATRLQAPTHCCLLTINNMQLQQLTPSCSNIAMVLTVLRDSSSPLHVQEQQQPLSVFEHNSSPHWLVRMFTA